MAPRSGSGPTRFYLGSLAYLLSLAALTVAGVALIAALGLAVDGYGVFGTRLLPAARFPPSLRLTQNGDRVTKAIEIAQRHDDDVLFMGDSRAEHGLDPDAPALADHRGYNSALAGATLKEQLVALDYALAREPKVRHLVWGLSLEAFPSGIATSTDFASSAFAGNSIASGLARHLFAFDSALSSLKALWQARHQVLAQMKRNGVAAYAGDPVEGAETASLYERELAGTSRNLQGPMPTLEMETAQRALRARLAELKARGLDVDLVIVPVHVWRLEFFRLIGIEAQDDAWKRELARMAGDIAAAPGAGKLRLFDFARPHPFVEQQVLSPPPPGERRYFLETSHFYPWLGDKILERLFGAEFAAQAQDFGRQIGPETIEEDIASSRAALDAWEVGNTKEVARLRQLIGRD